MKKGFIHGCPIIFKLPFAPSPRPAKAGHPSPGGRGAKNGSLNTPLPPGEGTGVRERPGFIRSFYGTVKLIIVFSFTLVYLFTWCFVYAEENWRTEFDNLCGKTEESMTMKLEELKALVVRCDKLKPVIEASDNPQKKVFLKRLEMCRNLFNYMIEVREKEKK